MGQFFSQFINYGRFGLELILGVFVLSIGLKKTNKFWLKFGILLGSTIIFSLIGAWISMPLIKDNVTYRTYISYVFFLVLAIPSIVFECFCYNSSASNKIYVILGSILTRNIARSIYNIVLFIVGYWIMNNPDVWQYGDRSFATLPVYYLGLFAIAFLLSVATRKVFSHQSFKSLSWYVVVILPLAMFLNIFIAILENGMMYSNPMYFFYASLVDVISTGGLLFSTALMTYMSLQEIEKMEDREQFNARILQYESISESIELINHKCHDLRHQLRIAKLNGGVDENFIEDVVKSIDIYDHRVETGNRDLNMILMDFKFRASAQNIETSIIADGEAVSFLERQDLISLFSNMLENAMNYVKLLEKKEERYISLKVYRQEGFIFIDCENPFDPNVDIPKKDKRFHGFGIPSMRRIAKKYDGAMSTSMKNGMYILTITFIS